MKMRTARFALAAVFAASAWPLSAQPSQPAAFAAGRPLGVTTDGVHTPMSAHVKVYGAVVSAESCAYDPGRKLILAVNRGTDPRPTENDAFVSLINPDGTVHTPKWIGATRDGLVLNQPLGSDIRDGKLYVADRDGGVDGAPVVSVLRMFDLKTGTPAGQVRTPDSTGFNDIAVARDGTVYASQSGEPYRIYKITPGGQSSVWLEGAPLARPNGVAIDNDGNVVVVNVNDTAVLTFSPQGKLVRTEQAAQAGNDGIVIMPDGTKYISSVRLGGVSRIRPGRPAELIAVGIPQAASMCLDSDTRQLVIPMPGPSGLAFIKLD